MSSEWTTRPAVAADYPRFARLFLELGVDDPTPTLERWESELQARTLFLEAGGEIIAYSFWIKIDDTAHVHNVVVDPAWRGRGAGKAMMAALARAIRAAGCSSWFLRVKVDNTPAIRLYEGCGLRVTHATTALAIDWDRTADLPREATPVVARPVDPAEDAAIEATFGRSPGLLQSFRRQERQVIRRLVDPARPEEIKVGVAAFDPTFPGAALFAVARPTLAAPLFEAIRPHARPEDTSLKLITEADPALVAALVAAGAAVRFEMLTMRGPIPPG